LSFTSRAATATAHFSTALYTLDGSDNNFTTFSITLPVFPMVIAYSSVPGINRSSSEAGTNCN
jgi:hypothetical protein